MVVHMADLVLPVAVVTGPDGARVVEVDEVGGVLVERGCGRVPLDVLSVVVVIGLDAVGVAV